MSEYETEPPRAKAVQRKPAAAGPSESDRFGKQTIAANLRTRILSVNVEGGRTRITIARGMSDGVGAGMEGHIEADGGVLATFQIDRVGKGLSYALVDITPDQLAGHLVVVINPTSRPAAAVHLRDVRVRIIAVSVEGDRTRIVLPRGTNHGVYGGMRGHLVTGGAEGEDFVIAGADDRTAIAYVRATVDQVHRSEAVLAPSSSRAVARPVQRKANGTEAVADVDRTARAGVASASSPLPHVDAIQRAFGKHDVSGVRAQIGGPATQAAAALGATAYATGDTVAFAAMPDLHTAAHEAAHTIQQKHGAVGFQGLGAADDAHERHADAVADAVVAGQPAEPLLDQVTGGGTTGAVQRKVARPDETQEWAARQRHLQRMERTYAGTDPMIVVGPSKLVFAKTLVGGFSTMNVAVRNDDKRRLVIDEIAPVRLDPFRDFTFESIHPILEPGEQCDLAIYFRPSRAGVSEQTFRLVTSAGPAGPAADIHVTGEGEDNAIDRTGEFRIATQDRERVEADQRVHDPRRRQRALAAEAVRTWAQKNHRFNKSLADWAHANWEDYLGKTGGDYELFSPDGALDAWKKVMAQLSENGLEMALDALKGAAKLAMLENPAVGLVASIAIDEFSEFMVDKFAGGRKPPSGDERAVTAAKSVSRGSLRKGEELRERRDRADQLVRDAESGAQLRIAQATTVSELNEWQYWATAQLAGVPAPKDPGDRSMSSKLLAEWVLQRAATPTSANADTNPKAWNEARAALQRSDVLPTAMRPDLFVHQCRYDWGTLALAGAEEAAARLDERRRQIEAELREARFPPDQVASIVASTLAKEEVKFERSLDPEQTAREFAERASYLMPDDKGRGREHFGGRFELYCELHLRTSGNAVYVNHFTYDVAGGRSSG